MTWGIKYKISSNTFIIEGGGCRGLEAESEAASSDAAALKKVKALVCGSEMVERELREEVSVCCGGSEEWSCEGIRDRLWEEGGREKADR